MSRSAELNGIVQQLECPRDPVTGEILPGDCKGRPIPNATIVAYAVDARNELPDIDLGRAISGKDGHFQLFVHHDSEVNDKAELSRWQIEFHITANGITFIGGEPGPLYALPSYVPPIKEGQAQGMYLNYHVELGDPLAVPIIQQQPWHIVAQRLGKDCGLGLDEVELEFDIERPFTELSAAEQRTIASLIFKNRISQESEIQWFVEQLIELLTPGVTPAEMAKDLAAEKAIKEALGCCDDCTVKPPIDLPPWDISLPKLPSTTSHAFQYSGLQLFVSGSTFNGRMYIP